MSWDYLYIFCQSNALEWPVALMKGRIGYRQGTGAFWPQALRIIALVTLANSLTHPIVFFGFMNSPLSYLAATLWAETFAVTAEAAVHAAVLGPSRVTLARCLATSFAANLVSWQVAPLLTWSLGRLS
jgi:hypothetical protein